MAAGMYPTREHMDEQRRLENCRGHLYRRIATLEQQVAELQSQMYADRRQALVWRDQVAALTKELEELRNAKAT